MANLKIGIGNSIDSIGFRMPINVLQKHSVDNKNLVLSNIMSSKDTVTTIDPSRQNIIINLNKLDFINNMLKNDMINKIPQHSLKNSKPRIIEFR